MTQDVIELRNVWKIFGDQASEALAAIRSEDLGKPEVLERFNCVVGVVDASFSVHEGEIFCVMGLSGSGKSTLVRHINRLLEPTAGEILINGEDVMAKGTEELRLLRANKIGMVFQNIALLPHRTVRDNVALPLEVQGMPKMERWDVAERSLSLVELNGWEDKFAHELSGGMQQRVGLARAMAADPDILLMDEPFSALDPLIRRQLQDQFMELSARMKKTTVFITHDLDEAIRIGDRIAIMKDGVIVQIGTPEIIVTQPADDYVADFVAGISRLKLVFAHSVMQSIDAYKAGGGDSLGEAPRVTEYVDKTKTVVMSSNPYAAVQGICVTKMTQDEHGIKSVLDLVNPDVSALFDTNGDGKGEIWIGAPGWASTNVEKVKAKGYGYDEFFELSVIEETLTLAQLDDAVKKKRPFVFFCYGPHHMFQLHELVQLEEPAYDESKWTMVQPTDDPDWFDKSSVDVAWPPTKVHIAYSKVLEERAPGVAALLSNIQLNSALVSAWTYAVVVDQVDALDYAKQWVSENPDTVNKWLGL